MISPILIAHEECTIISLHIELLIWWKIVDVGLKHTTVTFHFLTFHAPCTYKFRLTPWVPETEKSNSCPFLLVIRILELHDILNSICMIHDKTRRRSINNLWARLTITFDTTTHQTSLILSIQNEAPESFGSTVVRLDHPTREDSSLTVLNYNLFWLEPS
jgi:hypothetical protein